MSGDALATAAASGVPTLNPALRPFWLTPRVDGQPVRVRVLHGGRSSSKTWDAAGFAIFLASSLKVKFLCTRQYQNKIEESVYAVLKTQIERFGLSDEFRVLNNKIIHRTTGSEFLFYGLWRNIDEIKSLEGVDVCWIEEAHNLLEDQWRILRDTIRADGSQFWIIFNPRLATDFVYRRFVVSPPPGTLVRQINYNENPFLPETMRQTIEDVRAEDEEEYRHVFLGEPLTDDENVIIKRRWIQAAVGAAQKLGIEPTGKAYIGFDVADDGKDFNSTVARKGIEVDAIDEWKGGEDKLLESCARAWKLGSERGARVRYDSVGVGAFCGSHFKQLNAPLKPSKRVSYEKFNSGGAVLYKGKEYQPGVLHEDHFLNLKAQAWWLLADRFRQTYAAVEQGKDVDPEHIVSIHPDVNMLERLITELSTPRREFNANGKVMVEKKKDLLKRGVESPNIAEAFVAAFAPTEKRSRELGAWVS